MFETGELLNDIDTVLKRHIQEQHSQMLEEYSVTLNIEIETYQANLTLLNQFVKSGVQIKKMSWHPIKRYIEKDEDFVNVSDEELDKLYYKEEKITITSNDHTETFEQKDGFTVRDLFDCVMIVEDPALVTEKKTSGASGGGGGEESHSGEPAQKKARKN